MSYTQLTGLIAPLGQNPMIGPETGKETENGIALFFQSVTIFNASASNPHGGSYRFVRFVGGKAVAGIQVMSLDGKEGVLANAYCAPEFRRMGFTTELAKEARRRFAKLAFSEDRSSDGYLWVQSVQDDQESNSRPTQGETAFPTGSF
jgi:hypothetical protein